MLNKNKIHCMDALEGLKQLEDNSVDLIVTDPPYYIQNLQENLKDQTIRRSSKNNIFHAEWDSQPWEDLDDFKHFINKLLKSFHRILKPRGQVYMFMSYHHLDWAISLIKAQGFKFYKPLIWYKPDTMGVFPNQYGCNYEVILWFRNDKFSKKGEDNRVKLNIGLSQRDVFKINSTNIAHRKESGYHPTVKPIKLIRQFIKNGSDEGDLVLDAFMGSGTTAKACQEVKRNFIGFELDQKWVDVANSRLSQKSLNKWENGKL